MKCWYCKSNKIKVLFRIKLGISQKERVVTVECKDCGRVVAQGRVTLKEGIE